MSPRRVWIVAFSILFGVVLHVRADTNTSSRNPDDHYAAINPKKLQKEVARMQNGKMTQKDLNSFSAEGYSVSVLGSDSQPDVLPASARPQGELKLNAVYQQK